MNPIPNNFSIKHICRNRELAAQALAKRLALVISDAIAARGRANLVVSGGSSPVQLFSMLSELVLPWADVNLLVSDERIVGENHDQRNEGMIRQQLLQGPAADAKMVSLIPQLTNSTDVLAQANNVLAKLSLPFDAVVLGMGADGHTASLFPDCRSIDDDLHSAEFCVIEEVERLEHQRLSLTPATLLNTRELSLLFFGEEKMQVFERAEQHGETRELPVRFTIHQNTVPLSIYWAQ